MRTRIALAAASSVTFIGSTISLAAIHSPIAVATTKARAHSSRHHVAHVLATFEAKGRHTHRFGRTLALRTADLRAEERAGTEVIGTFVPLFTSVTGRHHGVHVIHVATPPPPPPPPAPPAPAPVATPAPVSVPAPVAVATTPPAATFVSNTVGTSDATSTATANWQCIRIRESGDVYNDPSRPSGAYGILDSTWLSLGYSGWPYQASATVQNEAALTLYNRYGWQPWSSRFACGL